jgi:hypothetical protein
MSKAHIENTMSKPKTTVAEVYEKSSRTNVRATLLVYSKSEGI